MKGIGIVLLCLVIFAFLLKLIGDSLYNIDENVQLAEVPSATLIICLAGGKGRIQESLKIFKNGHGDGLFIVGAGPRTTKERVLLSIAPSIFNELSLEQKERIYFENLSKSTVENAYAILRFLQKNQMYKQVLLITSSYHMKRSKIILSRALKYNYEIYTHTLQSEEFNQENWINSAKGINVTTKESGKLLLARLLLPLLETFE